VDTRADGSGERPLLPKSGFDYNASFSPDGKWIVFTSERERSAEIYRVHIDGSGLERLTDDPSCDAQGALSPPGSQLAFVSSRGSGSADIWVFVKIGCPLVRFPSRTRGILAHDLCPAI
jgi:TolB protein